MLAAAVEAFNMTLVEAVLVAKEKIRGDSLMAT